MNPFQHAVTSHTSQNEEALLRTDMLHLLHGSLPTALLSNVLLAVILVGIQWPVINPVMAVGWLILMGTVLAWRLLLHRRYRHAPLDLDHSQAQHLRYFRMGAIATGVVWGFHGLVLFPAGVIEHQVFLAFVLAGLSAGAITSLSADRTSTLGFIVPALMPLVARFLMEGGLIPLAMSAMTLLFLVFVTASATRVRQQLHENIYLRAESINQESSLRQQQQLNEVIARAQAEFIRETDRRKAFDGLLGDMLSLTESEYGFIGEVLRTAKGEPYLKTYAITNIAWNDATHAFYEAKAPQGMEFFNLKTLFGTALTTGEPVIANSPYEDPRRGGLPEGHPALNAFLGIPIHHGSDLVAMVGISNRPGGYDEALITFMQPLLITVGQLVVAARLQQQNRDNQKELARFKGTLDRTLDCVFMFDATNLRFTYANEGGMRQVGYSHEELLTMHPYDIKPDIDETHFHELITPLLAGEQDSLTFETVHKHKSGQRIPVEIFLQYIAPEDETPRFVAIVRDLTDRKRIERMKSEFVSTVSHELRTPLTSISGALGLLSGGALGELPAQAQSMINLAHQNSQRLTFLINDLLDMEKLLAERVRFDMQIHALLPLLAHAVQEMEAYARQHLISLSLTDSDDKLFVTVDSQRLQQVMANLLSNAIKFSPAHDVVEITVIRHDTHARIEVKDNGSGVPQTFRDRIFQKFAQADSSDTRQKGGTGLGLAISRKLIEHMGGKIGFESVEGEGATFFFELPIAQVGPAARSQENQGTEPT